LNHGCQKITNAVSSSGCKKNQSGCMKQPTYDIHAQGIGYRIRARMRIEFILEHPEMSAFVRHMPQFYKNADYFGAQHQICIACQHIRTQ
jgi:hypothetical protein